MSRYSVSREKFPYHFDLAITNEQHARAMKIAEFLGAFRKRNGQDEPVLNVGIRYAIDFCYITLLSDGSISSTNQPNEQE